MKDESFVGIIITKILQFASEMLFIIQWNILQLFTHKYMQY